MLYSQMFRLAGEADLSPEKLGKILGVSGMTLRRWKKIGKDKPLPKLYERAFASGVSQLVVDGHIDAASQLARQVMTEGNQLSFQATLKSLGFSDSLMKRKGDPNETLVEGLAQIGAAPSRIKEVDDGKKKLSMFARMGEEWKSRIDGMLTVIRSPSLTVMDKFVAYGALFYLLTPFDLIPDNIPVIGLLDDYAILGLALLFYTKRFPNLFRARSGPLT